MEKLLSLDAPLEKSGSQMQIEDVDGRAGLPLNLHLQTTAPFPSGNRDIVVVGEAYRLPREQDIPISSAAVSPVLTKFAAITEIVGKIASLMMIRTPMIHAHDFLQCNHIGIDFAQNAENSVRADASVQSTTFVDVVSNHTKPVGMGWKTRAGVRGLNGYRRLPACNYRLVSEPDWACDAAERP